MARWTIRFDAKATVNVEAETMEEALKATVKTLMAAGLSDLPAELVDCAIVKIIVIDKDEQARTNTTTPGSETTAI